MAKSNNECLLINRLIAATVSEKHWIEKHARTRGIQTESALIEGSDNCFYARINLMHEDRKVLGDFVDVVLARRSTVKTFKAA